MTPPGPDIRELRPDHDLDAGYDLQHRAFGPVPDACRPDWIASLQAAIGAGRVLGAFGHSRLAGSAALHDMRQWWHGRSLPMAGVAGVQGSAGGTRPDGVPGSAAATGRCATRRAGCRRRVPGPGSVTAEHLFASDRDGGRHCECSASIPA